MGHRNIAVQLKEVRVFSKPPPLDPNSENSSFWCWKQSSEGWEQIGPEKGLPLGEASHWHRTASCVG